MKLTTMLAVAALLSAPIVTQSAYAATDANEPSATETAKPPAKHKSMKHHKHHAKQQGKHYGKNVHQPAKHKAS